MPLTPRVHYPPAPRATPRSPITSAAACSCATIAGTPRLRLPFAECGSPYLKKFGAGTQRVEAELRALLDGMPGVGPDVPIIRMDADTTSGKGAHELLLEQFAGSDAAVLLGTQMIAKGLDFEDVTLVGVISADTQLHLPDYRAAERTFSPDWSRWQVAPGVPTCRGACSFRPTGADKRRHPRCRHLRP